MTIQYHDAEDRYVGDGATLAFAYGFKILDDDDIAVIVDGVTKTKATHYSVSGVNATNGGTVTFVTAPALNAAVSLIRAQPISQLTNFTANESYNPLKVMRAHDKGTAVDQMLAERIGRKIGFPADSALSDPELPEGEVGKFLRWVSTTELENVDIATIDPDAVALPLNPELGGTGSANTTGYSNLGTAGTAGRIRRRTSSSRGLWLDTGSLWVALNGGVFNVGDFGATGDGTTDDATAIQAAITAAEAGSGGVILFPPGLFSVATKLLVTKSNVLLLGAGRGHFHDVGTGKDYLTGIVWNGAAGGTMLEFSPATGASARRISGGGVKDIGFYGQGTVNRAAIGVLVQSVVGGLFDLYVEDTSTAGLKFGVVATLGEARDSQQNRIWLTFRQIETGSGAGLLLTGDATANTSFNNFEDILGQHGGTIGLDIGNSDNNYFQMVRLFRAVGTDIGIILRGGDTEDLSARANHFDHVSPGAGGVKVEGTGDATAASAKHTIELYDLANGSPGIDVGVAAGIDVTAYGFTQWTDIGWQRGTGPTMDWFGVFSGAQATVLRLAPLAAGNSFVTVSHGDGSTLLSALGTPAAVGLGVFVKGAGLGTLSDGNAATKLAWNNTGLGFFGAAPGAKPTITGSRGSNAALASLLTALATLGILVDSSS